MAKPNPTDPTALAPMVFIPTVAELLSVDGSKKGSAGRFCALLHKALHTLQRYSMHNGHATILAYTRWVASAGMYAECDVAGYGHATRPLPFDDNKQTPDGRPNWVAARVVFCTRDGSETTRAVEFYAQDFVRAGSSTPASGKFWHVLQHVQRHSSNPEAAAVSVHEADLAALMQQK